MAHKFHRPLTHHLAGHIRAHAKLPETSPVRVCIPDPSSDGIAAGSFHTVLLEKQLPVYAARAAHFALKGISSAEESGSVLLLKSPDDVPLRVDMTGTLANPRIEHVSSGDSAALLRRALARVAGSASRRHDMRLLRVDGTHCLALWVHSEREPAADVFYPLSPNFAGLRIGRKYSLKRFETILRKNAAEGILRWFIRYEQEAATRKSSPRTAVASSVTN